MAQQATDGQHVQHDAVTHEDRKRVRQMLDLKKKFGYDNASRLNSWRSWKSLVRQRVTVFKYPWSLPHAVVLRRHKIDGSIRIFNGYYMID